MKSTKDFIQSSLNEIKAPDSLYEFANNVPYMVEIEEIKSLSKQVPSLNFPVKKLTNHNFIKLASSAIAVLALIISSSVLLPMTNHNGVKNAAINEDQKIKKENNIDKQNLKISSYDFSDSTKNSLSLHKGTQVKNASTFQLQPQLTQDSKEQRFSKSFRDLDGTLDNLPRDMNFSINNPDIKLLQNNLYGLFRNQVEWSFLGPNENRSLIAETKTFKPNKQIRWVNGHDIVTIEEINHKADHTVLVLLQKASGKESVSLLNTKIALFDLKGNMISQDYEPPTLTGNGRFIFSFPEIKNLPDRILIRIVQTEDSSKKAK